jgi:hypothetical protein
MRIRFALTGLVLALAAAVPAASAAPRATITPQNSYKMEVHVVGSGGYSISPDEDYAFDSTVGEWSVDIVKLSEPTGYALDGGLWPYLSHADCTSASPSFSTDLSVCQ